MSLNDNYRIRRSDPRNIVIERRTSGGRWIVHSYHGNSPLSLVSGLLQAVMREYTPEDVKLSEQLETMQLELVSVRTELIKLIKVYCYKETE